MKTRSIAALAELLAELYSDGDPGAGNRRLRGLVSAISSELKDSLPGDQCARREYCGAVAELWFQTKTPLAELYKALVRDNPNAGDRIDGYFRPALAYLAFAEDGKVAPEDLFRTQNLVALVKQHAAPGSALARWLVEQAPGITQQTPDLPPVLYLVLSGNRVTAASLRFADRRSRELPLPETLGALPGIDVGSGADLVDAVRYLLDISDLPSPGDLVLVIEADPVSVALCPHSEPVPSTDHTLEELLTAVAWWPRIKGYRVLGGIHDGALPAPAEGTTVVSWQRVPEDRYSRQGASLGVWAAPTIWGPHAECAIVGRHNQRYFAVLADTALPELIAETHPNDAPAALDHLFRTIRRRARLIWTDRRYVLQHGVHLK